MLDEFGIPSALVNLSGPFPRLALYDLLFQDLHDFHEFLECRYYQGNLSDLLELSAIQELEYHFDLLRQHLLKYLCHPKWMNQIIFQSDNFHVKKSPHFITLDSKNVKSHEKCFFPYTWSCWSNYSFRTKQTFQSCFTSLTPVSFFSFFARHSWLPNFTWVPLYSFGTYWAWPTIRTFCTIRTLRSLFSKFTSVSRGSCITRSAFRTSSLNTFNFAWRT